ncbi:MAG: fatty acid desaturase family protein [Myxococcaceae bacterium]|nr:fatty acid desaturase family protein [Myxococcaceae bacterium]
MNPSTVVSMERIRALSKPSAPRAIFWALAAWVTIVALAVLDSRFGNPLTTVLVVLLIANQQHALLIQMHDASHWRLSQHRWLNDLVGELLCAWPMFFRMAAYRENHRMHHLHANTALDPDFRPGRFPKSKEQALKMLVLDVLALNTFEQLGELKRLKKPTSAKLKLARLAFYGTAAALITWAGLWPQVLLYWVVPLFTWLKVILRLRAIADHAGVEQQARPYDTRTVVPTLVDRLFVAPRNCSYHFGHHAYESVPWFNLKALHVELMQHPELRARVRVTRGFHRLLDELPSASLGAPAPAPTSAG